MQVIHTRKTLFPLIKLGECKRVLCVHAARSHAHLVKAACLTIPFLDRVKSRLSGEIKHEEDGDGVIAD